MHGRSKYLSVSEFIHSFFYKNCVVTMPQFYFAYFCGFSALNLYDDFYIQLYNVFFTCLPPILLGILYWDVMPDCDDQVLFPNKATPLELQAPEESFIEEKPSGINGVLTKLYFRGQQRKAFNVKSLIMIQFQGFFDSAIIFFLPFFACQLYGADVVAHENG